MIEHTQRVVEFIGLLASNISSVPKVSDEVGLKTSTGYEYKRVLEKSDWFKQLSEIMANGYTKPTQPTDKKPSMSKMFDFSPIQWIMVIIALLLFIFLIVWMLSGGSGEKEYERGIHDSEKKQDVETAQKLRSFSETIQKLQAEVEQERAEKEELKRVCVSGSPASPLFPSENFVGKTPDVDSGGTGKARSTEGGTTLNVTTEDVEDTKRDA